MSLCKSKQLLEESLVRAYARVENRGPDSVGEHMPRAGNSPKKIRASIENAPPERRFSPIHWLLWRRAVFRHHKGKLPLWAAVSPDMAAQVRSEFVERVGPQYARLIGRALFYGMVLITDEQYISKRRA